MKMIYKTKIVKTIILSMVLVGTTLAIASDAVKKVEEKELGLRHTNLYNETKVLPSKTNYTKKYPGSSYGPGGILFKYGEHTPTKWAEHTFAYDPEPGYMWIFPCPLRHEVIPFRTPGERISVSGNLYFIHPTKKSTAELPNLQQESEDIAGLAADAVRLKKK